MTGRQVQELLNYSVSCSGTDFFSQVLGVRFNIVDGRAAHIQLLPAPSNPNAGYSSLFPAATDKVAITDF